MEVLYGISWILFLLTASASPEIPSKGKHTRMQDAQQTSVEDADMPRFAEPIANVTVSIGRDALLACVVENLKGFKVAWVRVDTQTILSIHHNVISQNNRISLTYNDHRSWYLHIKEVDESDRGWYMCQVNTDPMRSRKGYLQVVVPPMIVEGMTSGDLVVREGLNVTLTCKAKGYPEPYVMWRREDGEEMLISGEQVNVVDGEVLYITKVSRLHMAAYLCVASNGVPPSISKRVHLRVQFPPMLSIPNQLEGAYLGQDVILGCHTEAYPASINYWTTERGDMIISDTSRAGDKYETTSTVKGYTKYMKLKIRSVGPNDFGTYRCVAKNSLGETDGNIKLDEMPTPTTSIISEMAMLNRSLDGKRRHRNKFDLNALPDYGVEEWRDGAGGNGVAGSSNGDDNNQTPVRNPPGAFHNSAGGSLAQQHNLLGSIIHWIKMQSFGIFKRLSSCENDEKQYKQQKQQQQQKYSTIAVLDGAAGGVGRRYQHQNQKTTTMTHFKCWWWYVGTDNVGGISNMILRLLLLPLLSTYHLSSSSSSNIQSTVMAITTTTTTTKRIIVTVHNSNNLNKQIVDMSKNKWSRTTTATATTKASAGYVPSKPPETIVIVKADNKNNNNSKRKCYISSSRASRSSDITLEQQNNRDNNHTQTSNNNNHNSNQNDNTNSNNNNSSSSSSGNNSMLQIISNIFVTYIDSMRSCSNWSSSSKNALPTFSSIQQWLLSSSSSLLLLLPQLLTLLLLICIITIFCTTLSSNIAAIVMLAAGMIMWLLSLALLTLLVLYFISDNINTTQTQTRTTKFSISKNRHLHANIFIYICIYKNIPLITASSKVDSSPQLTQSTKSTNTISKQLQQQQQTTASATKNFNEFYVTLLR